MALLVPPLPLEQARVRGIAECLGVPSPSPGGRVNYTLVITRRQLAAAMARVQGAWADEAIIGVLLEDVR
jgi:hypothetical protein